DILIIDSVATNRIVLKVKLLAAQYRVRPCATIAEARAEIAACTPDLIMMETGHDPQYTLAFCKDIKRDAATSVIPIIATGGFATPADRVNALLAGADDVLNKPFDDHILQARLRSLLRARDARQELHMRDGTRAALGFAEAGSLFAARASIAVASDRPNQLLDQATLIGSPEITNITLDEILTAQERLPKADLFIIDFRSGLDNENLLFRLLSELRSRSHTRHISLLVLLPESSQSAGAMALDLGANDVVSTAIDDTEIALRAKTLIQAKQEADALRQTVASGLEAAITDPLTGLFNRRYALPHLARLSAESHKHGRQFAVMVLDLDHFKSINDTYGHSAGDDVLRQVGRRLQDNLRAVDLVARIGGEEFLVAIPNSDVVHARTAAERLCSLISGAPFYIGPDRNEVSVTMSVGVSLSPPDKKVSVPPCLEELVNAADLALFDAKNAGRNTVSLSAA
ncbi:MAG: diguanylate cyclase, partial [Octadecabacter sp.]|nr:diguanylate cyclase [Octadecabacter sp.]